MRFTAAHKNDSPTVHGLSFGAMEAHRNGLLSEVELAAATGLSRAACREYLCGSEWHRVQNNGRVVEMFFGSLPDAETIRLIRAVLVARRAEAKARRACPAAGRIAGSEAEWEQYEAASAARRAAEKEAEF
jgi:hypothetical protein